MENVNKSNKNVIVLSVFVAVLAIMTIVFAILYAVNKTNYQDTSVNLENIYQRSFYDLVDNINNVESKMGKLLSSSDKNYINKLLTEIHENSNSAQTNLSYLPISINGIPDTIKFINQVDGYTATLAKNNKGTLSAEDKKTLNKLYVSIADIKYKLNDVSQEIVKGYSISSRSKDTKKDYTEFTNLIQQTKTTDTDYPKMIYDGPFSDTVLNKEIKGLNFEEYAEIDVKKAVTEIFSDSKITFAGETNGKFSTYDYNVTLPNGLDLYAQMTKKGAKLLTLSSYRDKSAVNFTKEQAIKTAEAFCKGQGIVDMKCVWSDVVGNDAYINLAPVINNIIYYPDLIKVKVDLSSGEILGWEATTYYTNHTTRKLPSVVVSASTAKKSVDSGFIIDTVKLALSPIDDENKEILTHEIKCTKDESIYYFYVDVQTGEIVNILKVIETDNGTLLM